MFNGAMFGRAILRIVVLPAAFVLIGPSQATAATVAAVVSQPPAALNQGTIFTAAPGEANDVTVTHAFAGPDQRVVTIHDSGAILDAGTGCASSDPHTARCMTQGMVAWFELGNGDDRLRTLQPYTVFDIVADGGTGDDVLDIRNGSAPFQGYEGILDGGGGHDQLYGGPFSDYLTDGDRDGAQGSAAPGPDVLDGGAPAGDLGFTFTNDVVSYEQRTAAVRVDLATELPAGERGEGDTVRHVESVYGGAKADHLAGTNGPNFLAGGPGHDTLNGRRGNDTFGSPPGGGFAPLGMPVRAAGAARGDTISCGSGRDTIHRPGNGQYIRPKCEHLEFRGDFGTSPRASVFAYPALHRRRSLTYTVLCPLNEESSDACSGRLTLRETGRARRLLAAGIIPRTPGETGVVARLRITPTGRQLATRRQGVLATMRMRGRNLPRNWWKIRLRVPR